MLMVCRSVWAGRFVRCMVAGAALLLGMSSPWAGSNHIDHMAWEIHNNK